MTKNFSEALVQSDTIVDEMQRVDPVFLRNYLKDPAAATVQDEERAIDQLAELVDLADHSGFLNHIRQERMENVAHAMAAEAGL